MKTIDIRPVTGFMDSRSNPTDVLPNGYRYVQNFMVTQKNKLCRTPGFDRALTRDNFNNQDLHDQLLSLTGLTQRYPITFLFQAISRNKSTKLIAGTERALYALNNSTGNWSIISDKLGGTGARWRADQLGEVIVFSNNRDEPVYWNYGAPPTEALDQSVAHIQDLRAIQKISKVAVVKTWKNHMFLMNLVQAGQVRSNRILWSSANRALVYNENTEESSSGDFDLDYDETILNADLLGNSLLVYTNKGIWEGVIGDNDQVFLFIRRYAAKATGEACLFYPNTLVSNGSEHLFAGIDGLYAYNLFKSKPELVEWMHKSSNRMFDDINRADCQIHIAAYYDERKEIRISYAKQGESIPSETLVYNTEFPFGTIEDHGYSAFITYTLKEPVLSLRQFILDNCICQSIAAYDAVSGGFLKEGGFCTPPPEPDCSDGGPANFWTDQPLDHGDGVISEDYTQVTPSEDSLCSFVTQTLQEICESEFRADECNSGKRFIAASSQDYCLKELSQNFYREIAVSFTGCGLYEKRGYKSILRSGPLFFNNFSDEKEIHQFEVEAIAATQTIPSELQLRIGNDFQASDPNEDSCGIVWHTQRPKDLECRSSKTQAQHKAANTRASRGFIWPLFYVNRFLFWELTVANPDATPFVDTGGSLCVSRFSFEINAVTIR